MAPGLKPAPSTGYGLVDHCLQIPHGGISNFMVVSVSLRRRNREDSVKIETHRWAGSGVPDARAEKICPMGHLPDAAERSAAASASALCLWRILDLDAGVGGRRTVLRTPRGVHGTFRVRSLCATGGVGSMPG